MTGEKTGENQAGYGRGGCSWGHPEELKRRFLRPAATAAFKVPFRHTKVTSTLVTPPTTLRNLQYIHIFLLP